MTLQKCQIRDYNTSAMTTIKCHLDRTSRKSELFRCFLEIRHYVASHLMQKAICSPVWIRCFPHPLFCNFMLISQHFVRSSHFVGDFLFLSMLFISIYLFSVKGCTKIVDVALCKIFSLLLYSIMLRFHGFYELIWNISFSNRFVKRTQHTSFVFAYRR